MGHGTLGDADQEGWSMGRSRAHATVWDMGKDGTWDRMAHGAGRDMGQDGTWDTIRHGAGSDIGHGTLCGRSCQTVYDEWATRHAIAIRRRGGGEGFDSGARRQLATPGRLSLWWRVGRSRCSVFVVFCREFVKKSGQKAKPAPRFGFSRSGLFFYGTGDRHGTWGMEHGARSMEHGAWGTGHDTRDMGHRTWDTQHGTWAMEHGTWSTGRGTWNSTEHRAWNMGHGAWNAKRDGTLDRMDGGTRWTAGQDGTRETGWGVRQDGAWDNVMGHGTGWNMG